MRQFTEEQRKALIEEVHYNLQHCFCSEKTTQIMQIALAVLTAPAPALRLPDEMPTAYYSVIQGGKTAMLPADDGQWLNKTTVLEWIEEVKRLNATAPQPVKE